MDVLTSIREARMPGKQIIDKAIAESSPNVYVYLSTDKHATDYVDLGKLKANNGNQNYNVSAGTDITKHNIVLICCKDLSVLFRRAVVV